MSIETAKYLRKQFPVDAIQVTEENMAEITKWCGGTIETEGIAELPFIRIDVRNPQTDRQTKAYVGDWVLYAGHGFKSYNDRAFQKSFDAMNLNTSHNTVDDVAKKFSKPEHRR